MWYNKRCKLILLANDINFDTGETLEQLSLPLKWWYNPELWRYRRTGSAVERPTEDEALRNIFYDALATGSKTRYRLNDLEKAVFKLYRHCKAHMPTKDTDMLRYEWVASQLKELRHSAGQGIRCDVFRVQAILQDVEQVIRYTEMSGIIEQFVASYELLHIDDATLKSLLHEMGHDVRQSRRRAA